MVEFLILRKTPRGQVKWEVFLGGFKNKKEPKEMIERWVKDMGRKKSDYRIVRVV